MNAASKNWRAYEPASSVVFHKTGEKWGALSNMAPRFPLVVAGEEWLSSEALYQACRFPHLPDVQRLIREQNSPMLSKMKSKPYRSESRRDWEAVRVKIMRWVLRVKLAQNFDRFSNILDETGEFDIVEQSHRDRYWGAVPGEDGILRGENVLGRLLMELRIELRHRDREELLVAVAPDVKDLVVLGQPVERVSASDKPGNVRGLF